MYLTNIEIVEYSWKTNSFFITSLRDRKTCGTKRHGNGNVSINERNTLNRIKYEIYYGYIVRTKNAIAMIYYGSILENFASNNNPLSFTYETRLFFKEFS